MGDGMVRIPVEDGGWMELPDSDPRAQEYQRKTQPTTYTVRPKDSLYTIAQRELGDANLWPNIAALNKIQNPNLILAGQTLALPMGQKPMKIPATTGSVKSAPANSSGQGGSKTASPPAPRPVQPEMVLASRTPASYALGYGHMFVFFEQLPEIGASTKIIRKVAAVPRNYAMVPKVDWVVPIPGVGPLFPARPGGLATPVEHVMNLNKSQRPFLSASDRVMGSPSIEGTPLVIDVAKVNAAGGRILTVEELTSQLRDFGIKNPARRIQTDNLSWTIGKVEGEVLINKTVPSGAATRASAVHEQYIQSGETLWQSFKAGEISKESLEQGLIDLERMYSRARIVGRFGRVLFVIGIVLTAVDLGVAGHRSIEQNSFKPIAAETVRQIGGWGGAAVGAKIGFGIGAALGIETGPGAILTGAVGALAFGAAGYFGADLLADTISPN